MGRFVWVAVLLVVLGGLVAGGFTDGWSGTRLGLAAGVGALAVIAVLPSTTSTATSSGGGRRR